MSIDFESIRELINKHERKKLKSIICSLENNEIANIIERLDNEEAVALIKIMDMDRAADIILELDNDTLKEILKKLDVSHITSLVEEMDSDDATDIVYSIKEEKREKILDKVDEATKEDIEELLHFPPESAGGKMRVDFLYLFEDETVEEALIKLRTWENQQDFEKVEGIFVCDRNNVFKGIVYWKDILFKNPLEKIKSIVKKFPIKAYLYDDQEVVAREAIKKEVGIVPVLDEQQRLRGIITSEDLYEVIQKENTEDLYHLAGLSTEEVAIEGVFKSVRKRIPWLYLNLLTAFLAAGVVGFFTHIIDYHPELAIFMPVVAGMGGNTGIQTITIIVRSLALGEITLNDAGFLLKKEFLVGFINGLGVGMLTGIIGILVGVSPLIGLAVFLAIVINMAIASMNGVVIPLIFKKIGVDPSLASGVLLTTFTDVIGYLSYLGFALLIFRLFT